MAEFRQLRKFSSKELILSQSEARLALKFIFRPTDHATIDALPETDAVREFAQALLVEAIDASYSVGYVEALFTSTANPTQRAAKVITSFSRKAAQHWFKHATSSDLMKARVYQFVVDYLALHFRKELTFYLASGRHLAGGRMFAYVLPKNATTRAG